jgi:hypothetical protein
VHPVSRRLGGVCRSKDLAEFALQEFHLSLGLPPDDPVGEQVERREEPRDQHHGRARTRAGTALSRPAAAMTTTTNATTTENALIATSDDEGRPTVPRTIVPPFGAGLITPSNQGCDLRLRGRIATRRRTH